MLWTGWILLRKQFLTKLENSIHATFKLFFFFWKIIMLSHCFEVFFQVVLDSIYGLFTLYDYCLGKDFSCSYVVVFSNHDKIVEAPITTWFFNKYNFFICISTNNFMTALITLGFAAMSKANSVGKYLADDYYSPTKNLVFSP